MASKCKTRSITSTSSNAVTINSASDNAVTVIVNSSSCNTIARFSKRRSHCRPPPLMML
uniref:Uncharacterized protein n=1 Tax=Medicago truncatula TaxID=3880 RepID=Q1SN31_MEDTR|nr:hypothetical protein MtrDRAFT_AC139525g9v2 [Medicago truncatula]